VAGERALAFLDSRRSLLDPLLPPDAEARTSRPQASLSSGIDTSMPVRAGPGAVARIRSKAPSSTCWSQPPRRRRWPASAPWRSSTRAAASSTRTSRSSRVVMKGRLWSRVRSARTTRDAVSAKAGTRRPSATRRDAGGREPLPHRMGAAGDGRPGGVLPLRPRAPAGTTRDAVSAKAGTRRPSATMSSERRR
jgi:hypothetical protein